MDGDCNFSGVGGVHRFDSNIVIVMSRLDCCLCMLSFLPFIVRYLVRLACVAFGSVEYTLDHYDFVRPLLAPCLLEAF